MGSIDSSLGIEVLNTGLDHSRLINRDNSTVGVSNELVVKVEGARVTIGRGIGSGGSSICSNRSSNNWGMGSIDSSLGIEVLNTGLDHSRLVNRDNSTVGVSNELVVKVEGPRVAVGRGIGSGGSSICSN